MMNRIVANDITRDIALKEKYIAVIIFALMKDHFISFLLFNLI